MKKSKPYKVVLEVLIWSGIHRPKSVGPGLIDSILVLGPDRIEPDPEKFKKSRTRKILEIGPVGLRILLSVDPSIWWKVTNFLLESDLQV